MKLVPVVLALSVLVGCGDDPTTAATAVTTTTMSTTTTTTTIVDDGPEPAPATDACLVLDAALAVTGPLGDPGSATAPGLDQTCTRGGVTLGVSNDVDSATFEVYIADDMGDPTTVPELGEMAAIIHVDDITRVVVLASRRLVVVDVHGSSAGSDERATALAREVLAHL